ncbi:hypothetical protein [Lysobacter gummosus]|uniref:Uncharacterized protein n=1 Tax=Lysobacter gummosus TaxID=262324 RepID=A0ABY3X8M4_9GAMM|nr:hypothetical protein [Lysobacter gummosus]UNP27819.1 hypothetical protein MOV92_15010 [Lysobacter gummosus]
MPIAPIRSAFIQRFRSDNRLAIIGPLSSGKRIHIGDVFEFGSVAHRAAEDAGFAPSRHHRSQLPRHPPPQSQPMRPPSYKLCVTRRLSSACIEGEPKLRGDGVFTNSPSLFH